MKGIRTIPSFQLRNVSYREVEFLIKSTAGTEIQTEVCLEPSCHHYQHYSVASAGHLLVPWGWVEVLVGMGLQVNMEDLPA